MGFLLSLTLLMLSLKIFIGSFSLRQSSLDKVVIHMVSPVPSINARYSLLVEESETEVCVLHCQVTSPPPILKVYHVIVLEVVLHEL